MTIRIPPSNQSTNNSHVYTIDFREVAPALSNSTMFKSNPRSAQIGGLAVGVPGELRGLEEAHRRWGTLSWIRLFAPSISLAQGWEIDTELGKRIPVSLFFLSLKRASPFALFPIAIRGLDVEQPRLERCICTQRQTFEDGRDDSSYKSLTHAVNHCQGGSRCILQGMHTTLSIKARVPLTLSRVQLRMLLFAKSVLQTELYLMQI